MPHKVFLSRLKLTDFRNYAALSLPLDGRHVVLTGQNGAGKTNLMEAVSFLSPGRGLRRAAYGDVPRAGSEAGFSVFATLEGIQGEVDIGTGTEGGEDGQSRKLRLNGTPARTVDELLDHLRVVWLTPSMDGLFTGPSADRRRFLDRLVLSLDPEHGRRAADFEKAMRGRNRLLSDHRPDPAWLTALEKQMAELGIAMAHARHELVGLLSGLVEAARDDGPFPSATMRLSGFLDGEWQRPAYEIEEIYLGNPHAALKVMAEGNLWSVELAPPSRTAAAGFVEGVAAAGDTVTAHGHRSKDPAEYRMKAERITIDGVHYDVYPNDLPS